jgi:hypothetical protein
MCDGSSASQEEYELADARLKAEADDRRRQAALLASSDRGRALPAVALAAAAAPGPAHGWRGYDERPGPAVQAASSAGSGWSLSGWGAMGGPAGSAPVGATRTLMDHLPSELRGPEPSAAAAAAPNAWASRRPVSAWESGLARGWGPDGGDGGLDEWESANSRRRGRGGGGLRGDGDDDGLRMDADSYQMLYGN